MHEYTFEVEDAEVRIGDATFYHCDAEVLVQKDRGLRGVITSTTEFSGTIKFTHPVPDSLFFGDDGVPVPVDVVAENSEKVLEIEQMFVEGIDRDDRCIEFIALDSHLTVEEEQEEPTPEERAIRLLDDLACEIADGDVSVNRVEFSRDRLDPIRYMVGQSVPVMGPTTLKVVYDE